MTFLVSSEFVRLKRNSRLIKFTRNRLGLFLFILSLFAFSTLSSLGIFANERLLFMRERANGYYAPSMYFLSKVGNPR